MTFSKPETTPSSFSRPSSPVVSMNIPSVQEFSSRFFYNYYTVDERTNENSRIPNHLKRKSIEQINTTVPDFSLRVPRYVKLQWQSPVGSAPPFGPLLANDPNVSIQSNLDKIQTEESFLKSKFSSHSISNYGSIRDASTEIMRIGGNLYPSLDAEFPETGMGDMSTDPLDSPSNNPIPVGSITSSDLHSEHNSPTGYSRATGLEPVQQDRNTFPNSISQLKKQLKYVLPGDGLNDVGFSLSKLVDTYNQNAINRYSLSNQTSNSSLEKEKFKDIAGTVKSVESIAANPLKSHGMSFYDANNNHVRAGTGYDSLKEIVNKNPINVQLNNLTVVDIFASSSMSRQDLKQMNNDYQQANKESTEVDDVYAQPTYVGPVIQTPDAFETSANLIGYLIERSILTDGGFEKDKTYTVENAYLTDFIDTSIIFGKEYHYSIRSIVRVSTTGYDEETNEIREIEYYIGSKPVTETVKTYEYVPPPSPVDLNFIWDYRNKKLQIAWGMPVNSQRDITQFQVFRRESLEEPFELISQKCFDHSNLKYKTGEVIDGNSKTMSPENIRFVEYSEQPVLFFIDEDFKVNVKDLKSSKYIYTVTAIDAHGMSSNYGAQFEVTFDFFKNVLVKKLISSAGAPKPYPNLYIKIDAFKDVIKTSGINSTKLKIYFMPEYFKIINSDGLIQRMVSTKQENAYYKIQFINLQNQKGDSLKITVDDPHEMTRI